MPTRKRRKPSPHPERSAAEPAQLRALRLLGRWTKLAQGHVLLGSGCSCGVGPGSMPVADFEQDIVGFLRTRHAGIPGESGLTELLRGIASGRHGTESAGAVLNDLEQSLDSFEQVHRP